LVDGLTEITPFRHLFESCNIILINWLIVVEFRFLLTVVTLDAHVVRLVDRQSNFTRRLSLLVLVPRIETTQGLKILRFW